jgi:integrase
MPRLVHRLPLPRLHRPSGQARLRIAGKEFWLGRFGSPEAQAAYDRLVGEYLANGRKPPATPPPATAPPPVDVAPGEATVTVLVAEFWDWAQAHYRKPDGTPTREADNFRPVLRRLRLGYGTLPVTAFGPARLLEFRDRLVAAGLARRTINAMVRRVRQVFRWGVSRELVPVEALSRLEALEPLQPGRGGRETSGSRGAVDWPLVEATLPALPPMLRAFVTVAFHTGARRGELARLTTGMLDRSKDVWVADLAEHKTAHKGKPRRLYIGPKAQAALTPWLLPDAPGEPVFSPLRVDARQARRKGKRLPGRYYSRAALDQALRRAVRRAGVEPWTLGQLRHSAAVRITDADNLEAARQALGHSTAAMTRHYASQSDAHAVDVLRRIG